MDLSAIFKAYDVRGIAGEELSVEAAERIGAAFARFVATTTADDPGGSAAAIAVGNDVRISSPDLVAALTRGITSQGTDVVALGLITTDMLYYVAGAHAMPGIVVTASHNPGEYNGLKFCLAGAAPVGAESGLLEVQAMAEKGVEPASDTGSVTEMDALEDYVAHVLGIVGAGNIGPLTVAVDGGNGMAGVALPRVFAGIAAEIDGLYLEPDGTFPNHPADPLRPENLVDLLDLVKRTKPDLGVAFDGDADRAFFVDDKGVPLPGSTTTAMVAEWYLAANPGATIVHNLICSRAVPEIVLAAGGTPVRTRVGHSYIKQVMKETGAVFGGEHSGHYYFKDHYRADSGILAMLILLRVLSDAGVPLSELRQKYEPYAQSGEINTTVADPLASIETVAEAMSDHELDRLDGLTVDLGDGSWFNLRPSNTEPLLRLNVEGRDAAAVDEVVAAVRGLIEGSPADEQDASAPQTTSGVPADLLGILRCPACGGGLTESAEPPSLVCEACRLRYPVSDGVPVMIVEEATALDAGE